jgi:hypothetical protein
LQGLQCVAAQRYTAVVSHDHRPHTSPRRPDPGCDLARSKT